LDSQPRDGFMSVGNAATVVPSVAPPLAAARLADYVQLTRPRLAAMALAVTLIGSLAAWERAGQLAAALHTIAGPALVVAAASALNQLLERRTDARMRRTEGRPLPAGRLGAAEVWWFGGLCAAGGFAYLWLLAHPAAAVAAALTLVLYVFA